MLHFVTSYMKQNNCKTLESAQNGLEISFKSKRFPLSCNKKVNFRANSTTRRIKMSVKPLGLYTEVVFASSFLDLPRNF